MPIGCAIQYVDVLSGAFLLQKFECGACLGSRSGGENNRGNLTEKDSCLFGGNDIRFFLRLILRTILRGILG